MRWEEVPEADAGDGVVPGQVLRRVSQRRPADVRQLRRCVARETGADRAGTASAQDGEGERKGREEKEQGRAPSGPKAELQDADADDQDEQGGSGPAQGDADD